MRNSSGCYCNINEGTGEDNGYTCNYCVNLLILLKNAIVEDKNELVKENQRLINERSELL